MSPRRASAAAAALLFLCSAGCSDDDDGLPPTPPADGLPVEVVRPALEAVDLVRFVTDVTLYEWRELGPVGASWSYDPGAFTWTRLDSSWSSVTVSTGPSTSTELRQELVVDFEARFYFEGTPRRERVGADTAELDLRVRRRYYATDPAYTTYEPFDVTSRFDHEFALTDEGPGPLLTTGFVAGWSLDEPEGVRTVYTLDGGGLIRFDHPGVYLPCPAEQMGLDVRVLGADGLELDRFTGSFGAAQGAPLYTGALQSDNGPARLVINRHRNCPVD